HLDELRGTQAEEGDAGLAGDRPGQKSLPRAGGADQQHALRHGPAAPLVLRGALQEVDDLDELVLGVVDARDVVEGDLRLRLVVALGPAAAEPEEATSAGHHALVHPDETREQEEGRAEAEKQALPEGSPLVERARIDDHALLLEERLEAGVGEGGP